MASPKKVAEGLRGLYCAGTLFPVASFPAELAAAGSGAPAPVWVRDAGTGCRGNRSVPESHSPKDGVTNMLLTCCCSCRGRERFWGCR